MTLCFEVKYLLLNLVIVFKENKDVIASISFSQVDLWKDLAEDIIDLKGKPSESEKGHNQHQHLHHLGQYVSQTL